MLGESFEHIPANHHAFSVDIHAYRLSIHTCIAEITCIGRSLKTQAFSLGLLCNFYYYVDLRTSQFHNVTARFTGPCNDNRGGPGFEFRGYIYMYITVSETASTLGQRASTDSSTIFIQQLTLFNRSISANQVGSSVSSLVTYIRKLMF